MRQFILAAAVLLGTTSIVQAQQYTVFAHEEINMSPDAEYRHTIYEVVEGLPEPVATWNSYVGPNTIHDGYYTFYRYDCYGYTHVGVNEDIDACFYIIQYRINGGQWYYARTLSAPKQL